MWLIRIFKIRLHKIYKANTLNFSLNWQKRIYLWRKNAKKILLKKDAQNFQHKIEKEDYYF